MEEIGLTILERFGLPAALVFAAFVIAYWYVGAHLNRSKPELRDFLQRGGWEPAYRRALTAVLDWLDRRLTPPEWRERLSAEEDAPGSAARAWNWWAYDRMLLLAVAYPILLPLLFWIVGGRPITLGGLEILETSNAIRSRLEVAWILAPLLLLGVDWRRLRRRQDPSVKDHAGLRNQQYGMLFGPLFLVSVLGMMILGLVSVGEGRVALALSAIVWLSLVISGSDDGAKTRPGATAVALASIVGFSFAGARLPDFLLMFGAGFAVMLLHRQHRPALVMLTFTLVATCHIPDDHTAAS